MGQPGEGIPVAPLGTVKARQGDPRLLVCATHWAVSSEGLASV